MARRVGFGDSEKRPARPETEPEAPPVEMGEADAGETATKTAGPVARLFIIAFLLVWLGLWSFGIHEAWIAVTDLWAGFDWDAFDIAMLVFFVIWLGGALIGWAFGVVILFVMLFGKETNRSPAESAKRLRRWRERRRSDR